MASERRVKHLWNCALSIDGETHAKKLLKSNLINQSRKIAGNNASITLERFAASQMCQHCSTHWQENAFHMKLKPHSVNVKSSKARKLIEKFKAQEGSGEGQKLLTKKQKRRAKWLLKRSESKVEICCEFCQHKTLVPLDKSDRQKAKKTPIVDTQQTETNTDMETPLETALTKKKKKKQKNKDKAAGLKIPKTLNEKTQTSMPKLTDKIEHKKPQLKKPKPTIKTTKVTTNAQSKTQKQNSLLQLAALLKAKDNAKTTLNSSAKNRLESLLK